MKGFRYRMNKTKAEDIRYLFRYLKRENQKNKKARHLSNNKILIKIAEILHVSLYAVRKVFSKKQENVRIAIRKYKYEIDDFDRELIKNVIFKFYSQRILPTATMIMDKIKDDIEITTFVLYKTLKDLGFCWRRTGDDRRVAIERSDTVAARSQYLRDIDRARRAGNKIIYLDETWVNQNHCKGYAWLPMMKDLGIDADINLVKKLPKIPPGKGKRLIILHAGMFIYSYKYIARSDPVV